MRRCIFHIVLAVTLLGATPAAKAQTVSDDTLRKVGFDQRLGAQISLDTPFRDENGNEVRLGDYFGRRPVILVLGYYGCPMLCTFVLNGMIGSLENINWEIGNQFDVVYVSIDPSETPALAAAKKKTYVKRYGRSDSAAGWHFLTGEEPAIRKLAHEAGFNYAYDASIKQYAHPSGLMILTADGKISQYLSGVIYSPKELNDALVAASASKTGSPVRELFLLCFHYSPITGKYGPIILTIVRVCGVGVMLSLAFGIIAMVRNEKRGPVSARSGAKLLRR